jgi:hypothetical protein
MVTPSWLRRPTQRYQVVDTYGDFRPSDSSGQLASRTRIRLIASAVFGLLLLAYWTREVTTRPQEDMYHGKTLTPSNYTVVQGIFAHSDPAFKDDGYDILHDSFGLIDKSPERWSKFERLATSFLHVRSHVRRRLILLAVVSRS